MKYIHLFNTILCGINVNSIYFLGSDMPDYDFTTLDFSKITHILYAFADIKEQETVLNHKEKTIIIKGKEEKSLEGKIKTLFGIKKKYRHVKIGISIIGNFGSFVDTEGGRVKFVSSITNIVKSFGFDFVDLDWEFPVVGFYKYNVTGRPSDTKDMITLIKSMKKQFNENIKTDREIFITMALPVSNYYLKHYDFDALDSLIEYYNVMCYDFVGLHTNYAYHSTSLYSEKDMLSVSTTIQDLINKKIPPNKLVIGIPGYAIIFKNLVDDKTLKSDYRKPENTGSLRDNDKKSPVQYIALNDLDFNKIEQYWDPVAKAEWGWNDKAKLFLTYDTARSVEYKMEFLKENKLRGTMFWNLAQDFPLSNNRSILNQLNLSYSMDELDLGDNNLIYSDSPFINVRDLSLEIPISSQSSLYFLAYFNLISLEILCLLFGLE